jgi:ABC-type sugar transport system substrate-binding protein
VALVAAAAASLALAACGGSSTAAPGATGSASGTESASASAAADPAVVQAAVDKALLKHVEVSTLDPVMQQAFALATQPLTPEQEATALECWKANTCTIPGGGDITVGVADGFGGNSWRKFSKMEAILQALHYPQVGKFIYLDANGDLAKMQTNVRSLVAQGAKVITTYNDFGAAMLPTFQQASTQGVKIATYASPVPGATAAQVTQVIPDLCTLGKEQADATAEIVGDSGEIAIFNGAPGNPQGKAWNKCALEQFAAKYPGITVTATEDTGWTPDGDYKAASAVIASGKPIKAILADYADPMPQIFKAYDQAGKVSPAYVTWTVNNDLNKVWAQAKGTPKAFDLVYTNGTNWTARVAVTAAMNALDGKPAESGVVQFPQPFVTADETSWVQDRPGDFVASLLVSDSLLDKMLAK